MSTRNTTSRRHPRPRLPLERVHVEVTSRCNFACEFCPNPGLERPHGRMAPELLERVIDELAAAGVTRRVDFHQQGEPMLYPHLHEGVARASRVGLETSVTTNGSLLLDRPVDRLLEAGLSELVVSLQTPDEASFAIRGARNLPYPAFESRVAAGVARVLRSAAPTRVRVVFLTKPLPRLTLPTMGRHWRLVERNADLHALLLPWARRWLPDLDGGAPSAAAVEQAVRATGVLHHNQVRLHPRLVLETRPVGEWPMPERFPATWRPAGFGTCQGISGHIAILWDGSYAFCCADHNGRTSTARFQDLAVLDYLDSEPVQAALAGLTRLRPVHPYCRLCLGGPHRSIVLVKAVGSIVYFKLLGRLRRQTEA